jgi:hypothetical protein
MRNVLPPSHKSAFRKILNKLVVMTNDLDAPIKVINKPNLDEANLAKGGKSLPRKNIGK